MSNARFCLGVQRAARYPWAMRIGINLHTLVGEYTGVQRSIAEMTRALCAEAPEDEFLAYVPLGWKNHAVLCAENLEFCRSWIPAGNRTLRIAWEQFVLQARVFRDGLDLFHAPCYVMPAWMLKPAVVNVHDILAFTHPEYCRRGNRVHFQRMLPKTVRRARRIIVPAHPVKRDLVDAFEGLGADRVRVIPWGVGECFRPVEDPAVRAAAALKYGLPKRFILHVGRAEPKKNLFQLVQAYFVATVNRGLPHRLVLAGPKGWGVEKLDRFIVEHGLESKVLRIGYIDDADLPALYSMAECMVFPSLAEGFGLPVLEAMACGTPVLASTLAVLREVAGDAAALVEAGSLPELREALETILCDEEKRAELSEKGRARAAEFTWAAHARKTLEVYREVLAEDAARHEE
jgi:glycosyltransferase involved in cell wall biosynthesis